MELQTFLYTLKTTVDIVEFILTFLEEKVDTVLAEITDVHYTSAMQAFTAANKARTDEGRRGEIRAGIGHLRVAFNTTLKYASRDVTLRDILQKKSADKLTLLSFSTEIATLIAEAYARIDELDNARDWKVQALQAFDKYADLARWWTSIQAAHQVGPGPNPMSFSSSGVGFRIGSVIGPNSQTTRFDENQYNGDLARLEAERLQIDGLVS